MTLHQVHNSEKKSFVVSAKVKNEWRGHQIYQTFLLIEIGIYVMKQILCHVALVANHDYR